MANQKANLKLKVSWPWQNKLTILEPKILQIDDSQAVLKRGLRGPNFDMFGRESSLFWPLLASLHD